MNVLIVEDNLSQALAYEMILDNLKVDTIRIASDVKTGLSAIADYAPDFILLDIHLANGDCGLELAKSIEYNCIPFIVITGYPVGSLMEKVQKLNAESFLVKPVNHLTLQFEIEKLISKTEKLKKGDSYLVIRDGRTLVRVPMNEIIYVHVIRNYATIYTSDRKFLIKRSLLHVSKNLDSNNFMQVHRSTIINLNCIKDVNFSMNEMVLTNDHKIKIGNKFIVELRRHVKSLMRL